MEEKKIIAEVFEVDRMKDLQRLEYLNCFKKMFNTSDLPLVIMKDQIIGGYSNLEEHFK